jgi:serine/threonine protein kinase
MGLNNTGFLMELMDQTIWRYVNAEHEITENEKFQLTTCKSLCDGLAYLHSQNIIHRDIKPENMLIKVIDGEFIIKYADFGSSINEIRSNGNHTRGITTLYYRSPELLLNKTKYDERVDVWSLGCSLYEIFSSKILFYGHTRDQILISIFKFCGEPIHLKTKVNKLYDHQIEQIWKLCDKGQPLILKIIKKCIVVRASTDRLPGERCSSNELVKLFD